MNLIATLGIIYTSLHNRRLSISCHSIIQIGPRSLHMYVDVMALSRISPWHLHIYVDVTYSV